MRCFRLSSFVRSMAGSTTDQVTKFKWYMHHRYHLKMINERFNDVTEAANATYIIEMEILD